MPASPETVPVPRRSSSKQRRAFTLIEMLVVISIITLLFADAHAERRRLPEIQARYSGNWRNLY